MIKTHAFVLADFLLSYQPDIVFLSEPQIYQNEIDLCTYSIKHKYCFGLNSDDVYDPELPLRRSKSKGGTMAMWKNSLDPYVTQLPSTSSAILPLLLKLPERKASVHIAIYLPTHGKDVEFLEQLSNLQLCIDDIKSSHNDPIIFVRGDGNCNEKNVTRCLALQSFIQRNRMQAVQITHPTYHHSLPTLHWLALPPIYFYCLASAYMCIHT